MSIPLFRVLPLLALFGFATPFRVLAQIGSCGLRVSVTDMYGNRIPAERIRLADRDGSAEIQQDAVVHSQCGEHTLDVTASGARPAKVIFDLHQAEQVVAVTLGLGAVEGPVPTCTVLGEVTPDSGVVRVRLLQLFGNYSVDVVPVRGGFSVRNVDCGSYLLVAMGKTSCLGTMTLDITATTGRVAKLNLKREALNEAACTSIRPSR